MGLDITAYSNIRLVKCAKDNDFDEDNWDKYLSQNDLHYATYLYKVKPHKQCDTWGEGIYLCAYRFDFRAGSYSGYEEWYKWLFVINTDDCFVDLLTYPECESFIGPDTSKKLYVAFVENFDKAKDLSKKLEVKKNKEFGEWFLSKYIDWMTAFKMASQNGAVRFH